MMHLQKKHAFDMKIRESCRELLHITSIKIEEYKKDFQERYGILKNPDIWIHFSTQARFFEGVGVLVKRKLVDPALVDDLMSGNILQFWEKFGESIIKEQQVRENYPQFYEHVEYLYNVIKPIVDQQHPGLKT